jgi:hypothetical protein
MHLRPCLHCCLFPLIDVYSLVYGACVTELACFKFSGIWFGCCSERLHAYGWVGRVSRHVMDRISNNVVGDHALPGTGLASHKPKSTTGHVPRLIHGAIAAQSTLTFKCNGWPQRSHEQKHSTSQNMLIQFQADSPSTQHLPWEPSM